MKKITITGTKGKTTVTYAVASVLQALGNNVLRVDTTGHYVNGRQRSTLTDASRIWGLVPSVAPGRYLWEFLANPELERNGVAVMESSLGSSGLPGMGYRVHDVGVFLNVYEDHLGSSERLKTKAGIAEAKKFVFERLERNGWVVCNADDKLVVSKLKVVPDHLNISIMACGLDFSHFDLKKHLEAGSQAMTVKQGKVVLLQSKAEKELFDVNKIPWTFNGHYQPSLRNLLMAAAAVYAYYGGKWPAKAGRIFEGLRLDKFGGRLTLLRAANGATVIADYAHEKVSLIEIAKMARTLAGPDGKLIGVVRLAIDRTDKLLQETGSAIAGHYDQFVVYDKIDGHLRQPRQLRSKYFTEQIGYVSDILARAINEAGGQAERIVREDQAARRAAQLAGPNDVVVYIVNDDIKRSIDFIKDSFKADFV